MILFAHFQVDVTRSERWMSDRHKRRRRYFHAKAPCLGRNWYDDVIAAPLTCARRESLLRIPYAMNSLKIASGLVPLILVLGICSLFGVVLLIADESAPLGDPSLASIGIMSIIGAGAAAVVITLNGVALHRLRSRPGDALSVGAVFVTIVLTGTSAFLNCIMSMLESSLLNTICVVLLVVVLLIQPVLMPSAIQSTWG